MAAINDFDYVLMNKAGGGQVWLPVTFGSGCSVGTVNKTPAEVAALSATMPATPSGAEVLTRSCSGAGPDTEVVFDPDFQTTPENPNPDPGGGNYTGVVVQPMKNGNTSFMNLTAFDIDLDVGQFNLTNQSTPNASGGNTLLVATNNQKWVNGLGGDYAIGWPYVVQLWHVNAGLPEYARRETAANKAQTVLSVQ